MRERSCVTDLRFVMLTATMKCQAVIEIRLLFLRILYWMRFVDQINDIRRK